MKLSSVSKKLLSSPLSLGVVLAIVRQSHHHQLWLSSLVDRCSSSTPSFVVRTVKANLAIAQPLFAEPSASLLKNSIATLARVVDEEDCLAAIVIRKNRLRQTFMSLDCRSSSSVGVSRADVFASSISTIPFRANNVASMYLY